ncbi:MAG TPA: adenylate/guanylate cyclase domain-containing protein [Opitutaceae bacterium]|nr:adenylate/guanylate cyclase domain-containing protein [Opitutaceae bacterium]
MKHTLAPPTVEEQIIVFADLAGFHRVICSQLSPEDTFAFLSDYYAAAQGILDGSGGRLVKFIGDAMLIVFPSHAPDRALVTLRTLKAAIDALLVQQRLDSRLRIKAHVGTVAAGAIGSGELERFDVCGSAVDQAALLPDGEWVLSDELRKRTRS